MNSDSHLSKQASTTVPEPPAAQPASSVKVIMSFLRRIIWLLPIFGYFLRAINWLLEMFGYFLRWITWSLVMFAFFIGLGAFIGEKIGGSEGVNVGAACGGGVMLLILIFCVLLWLFRDSVVVKDFKKRWKKEEH